MAAEEVGAARQGWGWGPHGVLALKLAVGHQDGYGVVLRSLQPDICQIQHTSKE
jgi:hypothetical protein